MFVALFSINPRYCRVGKAQEAGPFLRRSYLAQSLRSLVLPMLTFNQIVTVCLFFIKQDTATLLNVCRSDPFSGMGMVSSFILRFTSPTIHLNACSSTMLYSHTWIHQSNTCMHTNTHTKLRNTHTYTPYGGRSHCNVNVNRLWGGDVRRGKGQTVAGDGGVGVVPLKPSSYTQTPTYTSYTTLPPSRSLSLMVKVLLSHGESVALCLCRKFFVGLCNLREICVSNMVIHLAGG